MKYFKKENFDKCMEFLADKPDSVETQQELYKFMHEYCKMMPDLLPITVKNMAVYSKVYATRVVPKTANWCCTMSDGSQVVWNKKYQEFYSIDEVGMERCGYIDYSDLFVEIKDIDKWLLENWSEWRFQETQRQLVAIWCGRYNQVFQNYWR